MTSVVVKSTLSEQARAIVGDALQHTLADLIDLSLVAKQVHWNVHGPRFRSVHLQLDDVVTTARTYADTVAERSAAIGVPPDGRAGTVAKFSLVREVHDGWIRDGEVVDVMVEALAAVVRRVRDGIEATGDADPVSQDILIGLAAELEKHHWMFQAENA
ncbi:DNA starvation/stationary phase protection protein [Streptomyces sp. NPDC046977]|uniref:Dps family protein n=1 Tax=Streptomyces sp. NPDC046977 TaxID=3154703 RepID=UPI0033D5D56E